MSELERYYPDESTKQSVPEFWRAVALLVLGTILGMAPGYVYLMIADHGALTRDDVDHEIAGQVGGKFGTIQQQLSDMSLQLAAMQGQINGITGETPHGKRF